MGPEATAKPIGLIVPTRSELAEFYALSTEQKGYFLHWARSNQRARGHWWRTAMRKAREQRPNRHS